MVQRPFYALNHDTEPLDIAFLFQLQLLNAKCVMPGTFELLILAAIPLVGLLLIVSAIFRLRKKLTQNENPTVGTYINELGGYGLFGVILLVGGLAYAASQILGGGDPKPVAQNPEEHVLAAPDKEQLAHQGNPAKQGGKLDLDLFVPETPQQPLNDEPLLEAVRANRELDGSSSPGFELLQRGRELAKAENYEEAAKAFTDALTKDAKLWPAFQERGRLLASFGIHDQAIKDFSEVLRLAPGLKSAYKDRAASSLATGDLKQTIADCTSALTGNFADPEVFNLRGLARSYQGDHRRAIEDFTAALRIDPTRAIGFSNRAHSLMSLGATSESLADCNRALRIDPSLPEAYHRRGRVYRTLERWPESLKDFDKAIELDPEFPMAFADRALLRINSSGDVKNPNLAVKDATVACELVEWRDFMTVEVLARAYVAANQAENARKYADLMVELAPTAHQVAAKNARDQILKATQE